MSPLRGHSCVCFCCWCLGQVPKMIGVLRQEWAPAAFVVSFKLETDEAILVSKVCVWVGRGGWVGVGVRVGGWECGCGCGCGGLCRGLCVWKGGGRDADAYRIAQAQVFGCMPLVCVP
jgi:hypothetical protein